MTNAPSGYGLDPIDHRVAKQLRATVFAGEVDLRAFETIIQPDHIQSGTCEHRDQRRGFPTISVVLVGGFSTRHVRDGGAECVIAADFVTPAGIAFMLECRPDPVFPELRVEVQPYQSIFGFGSATCLLCSCVVSPANVFFIQARPSCEIADS